MKKIMTDIIQEIDSIEGENACEGSVLDLILRINIWKWNIIKWRQCEIWANVKYDEEKSM